MTAPRLLVLAAIACAGVILGHVALTAALSLPDLTARAAVQARW